MATDGSTTDFKELFKRSLIKVSELKASLAQLQAAHAEPIAIVGMACRFPGGADTPEALWRVFEQGVDAVVQIPAQRWPAAALPADDSAVRWAGLLDSLDGFDAAFFGISPREAASLDPQQRLLLEVSWEALESAGVVPATLMQSPTGVFFGLYANEYRQRLVDKGPDEISAYDMTGTLASTAAGRVSYVLGLQGPCMTIDTACSSSLVAVHTACASLRSGECDLALAGGANVIADPTAMLMLSRTQALSRDGRCKTFDAGANGFVRAEGCGVVVLKRLGDALAARDRILAVIRGSAVNQDGRSAGLTAPNVLSQRDMLRTALERAQAAPADVGLVETHGTGTALGDPIEVEAIKEVLGAPRADGSRCYLGALKTNLGHLEAAAGIAGLIKAVLCLQHEAIPRNLHFRVLNPRIDLHGTPLTIPTQQVAWPRGARPRLAGVSSFGLSGTNAHVLVEEAPPVPPPAPAADRPAYLLPLSGRTPAALRAQAAQYARHLDAHPEQALRDIAYTASLRRTHFAARLAVAGATSQALAAKLRTFLEAPAAAGALASGAAAAARKIVFVFPGQGGQWLGMGRELLAAEPVFRRCIEECDRLLRAHCDWSLLTLLRTEDNHASLERVDVVQPAMFAIQVSLTALLGSWGVAPAAVVGHSMGEVAAACAAGALSLESACRLICIRSQLVRRRSGQGGMAAVELARDQAEEALQAYAGRLAVAAINGPRTTVLSGDGDALDEVLARLAAQGVLHRRVKIDYASHSPQMDPLLGELQLGLAALPVGRARTPFYSTVTGQRYDDELTAAYWQQNLRAPVQFLAALQALSRDGYDAFVEINPHPILLPSIEAAFEGTARGPLITATLRRGQGGVEPLLQTLGALYMHGCALDWTRLYPGGGELADLPTYPWQKESHWVAAAAAPPSAAAPQPDAAGAPPGPRSEPAPTGAPSLVERLPTLAAAARHAELEQAVRAAIAAVLGLTAPEVPPDVPLRELGLDSLMAVELSKRLSAQIAARLPVTVAFDFPTLTALTAHLQQKLLALPAAPPAAPAKSPTADAPIAILGMSCRFPGGVTSPEALWDLLVRGEDAIAEVPRDKWDRDRYYDPDPDKPGKIYSRYCGTVTQVDQFDAGFFSIPPREAVSLDPQQRMLLEVSWEALERAGQSIERLAAQKSGVFLGLCSNDYGARLLYGQEASQIDAYAGTGNLASMAAGRLSYLLGLTGPALVVDTACSSSLVAIHLSCQSLRDGECSLALAGGVNLLLAPSFALFISRLRALSPSGRCKTFDAAADGFVRSDGCGVVVLKRLADAQRDGDPILAVIRGSAVNQDGRSNGLTAPSGPAQQAVIRAALHKAGVLPAQVGYVEAHGTGTALGDPIELQALGAVLGEQRPVSHPVVVGALKSNIGHTEAAAGVAGLIKAVLVVQKGEIPANLHFHNPSPHIPWDELPVTIPTRLLPWPTDGGARIAGVSSFGLSGTNAHLILTEPPPAPLADRAPSGDRPLHILPLSAKSTAALRAQTHQYAQLLAAAPHLPLADVCYSAATGRGPFDERLTVIASSLTEAREQLEQLARGDTAAWAEREKKESGRPRKVAFLFTGQGSQYVGMGRDLYETQPVFRAALDRCAAILAPRLSRPLLAVLWPAPGEASPLDETAYTQPALFALEYALAELWRSWGIEPAAVLGHSVGEYVAATVAGVMSLADGLALVAERGRLMQALGPAGEGEMISVRGGSAQVAALLERYPDDLSIAAFNGPTQVIVSGRRSAMQALLAELAGLGIHATRLAVSHAFHSQLMDPMLAALSRAAGAVALHPPQLPLISNLSAEVAGDEVTRPEYWRRHAREPVHFMQGMRALRALGVDAFVEIGPQPTLLGLGSDSLGHAGFLWLPSLRKGRDAWSVLLTSLGRLWQSGARVDWQRFDEPYARRRVPVPTYPWQHERYWVDPQPIEAAPLRPAGGHPLLGSPHQLSTLPGVWFWQGALDPEQLPYLRDHCIQDAVLFPGTGYLEMALAAARSHDAGQQYEVAEVILHTALVLTPAAREVQLVLNQDAPGHLRFHIASRQPTDGSWLQHASGLLRPHKAPPPAAEDLAAVRSRCREPLSGSAYYAALSARGLAYGKAFQGVRQLARGPWESLSEIEIPDEVAAQASAYVVHPALLDACLQGIVAALGAEAAAGPLVPVGYGAARLYQPPGARMLSHARVAREGADAGAPIKADVRILDERGQLLVEVLGVTARLLDRATETRRSRRLMYQWRAAPLPAQPPRQPARYLLLAEETALAEALRQRLQQGGADVTRLPLSHLGSRLDAELMGPPYRAIVYLGSFDGGDGAATTAETLEQAGERDCGSVLQVVQALARAGLRDAPRLWLITRGVHAKEEGVPPPAAGLSPAGALLWGLGRTIANEQSELACTRVDLAPTAGPHELDALCRELQADDPEQEVALRPGGRFVGRLIWQAAALTASERVVPAQRTPFRLDIDIPGVLDRLKLRASQRRAPGPGEVEIEVEAAGLNFLDVLTAMGIGPGQQPGAAILGRECAGRITAVGEGVEGLAVGEPVLALASRALASHVTTQARWVVRRPPRWSAAQAAAIPVVYLTAYYGLITLGRLRRGERVLIHSAAGGTGLAAVRLAQAAGAEIFATAGSAEKRDFLRGIGVPHVMDSRSLDFAAEILQRTGGRGVDVVLNSLTGAAIEKSLSALAPYGRFIEIGKRDIYDNAPLGLGHFRKRLSYHAVDLGPMMEDRPHEIDELLRHVVREIDAGKLLPLPVQEFPISQAHAAFHRMAQGAHIGKLVLTLSDPAAQVAVPTAADFTLPADGTYLITGGLGGLGLALAAWMVDRGCRHLALLSRHGAQSPAQHAALAALQEAGAEVEVITADVAQRAEVAAALAALRARLPALRGIVHAAGVVEDGLLLHQDMQRFGRVMAPKVLGAWNLHELTRAESLDFFVLYSSAAALLGMPGQGNYAAANAFLDALAHHRRAQGLPALSINWGPLGEAGMAVAQPNRGARLATIGFTSLSLAQAHEELAHLLQEQPIQAGVLILDARQWVQYYPQVAASTLLSEIVQEAGQAPGAASGDQSVRKEVQAAPPEQRSALLAEYLREQLGRVLRLRPADIDRTRTFRALGVDSLMGLELRNRLEAGLGLVLPVTLIWAYPSVQALAEHLVAKLCPESASGMRTEASAQADELAAGLQQLSDEELLLAAGAALAGQADEN